MASLSEPAMSVAPSTSKELMGSGDWRMQVVSVAPRDTSLPSHTVTLPPANTHIHGHVPKQCWQKFTVHDGMRRPVTE